MPFEESSSIVLQMEPLHRCRRYLLIAAPPSPGAVHEIVTNAFPVVNTGLDGAPGMPVGTARAAADTSPAPTALLARTVKLYEVPFVRPETVHFREFTPVVAVGEQV
jgi:hypothetical protein